MSELEDNDHMNCSYCKIFMNKILLCKNRSRHIMNDNTMVLQRCYMLVCADCEYCQGCQHRYQELKNRLKEQRYGKPFQKDSCADTIERLQNEHNKTYVLNYLNE